jgi:hypothetical protein
MAIVMSSTKMQNKHTEARVKIVPQMQFVSLKLLDIPLELVTVPVCQLTLAIAVVRRLAGRVRRLAGNALKHRSRRRRAAVRAASPLLRRQAQCRLQFVSGM